MLAQDGTVPVVTSIVKTALDQLAFSDDIRIVIPVGCATGFHRADMIGRLATDCLNALVLPGTVEGGSDGVQPKVFECQLFSLAACKNKGESQAHLGRAWKWAESAWCGMGTPHELTGTSASCIDPDANGSIQQLYRMLEKMNEWLADLDAAAAEGEAQSIDDANIEEAPERSPASEAPERSPAGSEAPESEPAVDVPPPPSQAPGRHETQAANVKRLRARLPWAERSEAKAAAEQKTTPRAPLHPPGFPIERISKATLADKRKGAEDSQSSDAKKLKSSAKAMTISYSQLTLIKVGQK